MLLILKILKSCLPIVPQQAWTVPSGTPSANRASPLHAHRKRSVAPALPCIARALHHAFPQHRTSVPRKDAPSLSTPVPPDRLSSPRETPSPHARYNPQSTTL